MAKKTVTETDPSASALANLGAARQHWDKFMARAQRDVADASVVWKQYAGNTGRQCVVRMKDRNLAYLKPGDGSFLVSVALSDGVIAGLGDSTLPTSLVEEIMSSKKYPEGRAARVLVDSESTLRIALTLIGMKRADLLARKRTTRSGGA